MFPTKHTFKFFCEPQWTTSPNRNLIYTSLRHGRQQPWLKASFNPIFVPDSNQTGPEDDSIQSSSQLAAWLGKMDHSSAGKNGPLIQGKVVHLSRENCPFMPGKIINLCRGNGPFTTGKMIHLPRGKCSIYHGENGPFIHDRGNGPFSPSCPKVSHGGHQAGQRRPWFDLAFGPVAIRPATNLIQCCLRPGKQTP